METSRAGSVRIRPNPDCDRGLTIVVGDAVIASANYDEHGWSGIDAVEKVATAICQAYEIRIEDER